MDQMDREQHHNFSDNSILHHTLHRGFVLRHLKGVGEYTKLETLRSLKVLHIISFFFISRIEDLSRIKNIISKVEALDYHLVKYVENYVKMLIFDFNGNWTTQISIMFHSPHIFSSSSSHNKRWISKKNWMIGCNNEEENFMIIFWAFVKRCENGVHVFKQGKVDDSLLWVQKNYK